MYRVRTFNQIAAKGLRRFPEHGFEIGPDVAQPHALLLRSHRLSRADLAGVSAVARAGAGVNNVPVADCSKRGIVVFNTPGANANSVKELVLAALLLTSRDILGGLEYVYSLYDNVGDDAELHRLVEQEKRRFKGREVAGRTLGIVGLGAIGSRVARAALNLDMDVIGYDPVLSVDAAWRLPSSVKRMENLAALLTRSDYVTLHIPALAETIGLIDANALAQLKPGAVLLNFARQQIVDEQALKPALTSGRLKAYFADFPSTQLAGIANVHTTPHLGASTAEAEENCAVMAVDQLSGFLRYGNIDNSVNFPMVTLDPADGYRIGIANVNVAGMLGKLMAVFAEANINIIDMLNKSRGQMAYNLIDVDTLPSDALLARIEAIAEVLSVRVFDPVAE